MIPLRLKGVWNIARSSLPIVIFLIVLITACLILAGNMVEKQSDNSRKAEAFEEQYGKKNWYWTVEALNDSEFYTYMEDISGKQRKKADKLRQKLESEEQFMFFTCSNHPIWMKNNVNDIFLEGYESGDKKASISTENGQKKYTVKALMVSGNFFKSSKTKIGKGKGFGNGDYRYKKGQPVPVLLGHAYEKYYDIGDCFEAEYLFEKMTLKVSGFMDKKTFYLSSSDGEFVSAERYIILPALYATGKNDWFSQYISLAALNGTIESKTGYKKTVQVCENHLKEQGIFWNLNIQDPQSKSVDFAVSRYSKMTKQVKTQFDILVALVLIFAVIVVVINIFSILRKNQYSFGVKLLCGASYKDIIAEGTGFAFMLVGTGDVLSTIILALSGNSMKSILLVQTAVAIVSMITVISTYLYARKMQISEIIGGKE